MILRRGRGRKDKDVSLFALTQAHITLDVKLNARFTGSAALCVKESTGVFDSAVEDAKGFLEASSDVSYRVERDRYGYMWFIIGSGIEGAMAALDAIADTFTEHGFREQILAGVFAFNSERRGRFYLIYNYRSNRFYPFAPSSRDRDVEFEMLIYSLLKDELPMEKDRARWYPIWDIPF
ncbi:MAG: hypothetical protein RMJ59_01470 [Candidatus Nitrosocaldus sp.]|nr:hypothetical protein [Candidatus Nitrosocaldus sp.]MCS7140735.1 hypothetical protein [Candidatus Nitrosocaldus sp.]MDW7999450.1 hypothetical protein [Candidatus Nitrosocaldus sp.]MDW8275034.1 hypothetical protein [Candidatus Nitrosocaldus sp.]